MIEPVGIVLSISSLVFSLYVYVRHERKLNGQQKKINELNIRKMTWEEEVRNRVSFSINRQGDFLYVKNIGYITARNVRIDCDDDDVCFSNDRVLPRPELRAGECIRIMFLPERLIKTYYDFTVIWDDDSGTDNRETYNVNLRHYVF